MGTVCSVVLQICLLLQQYLDWIDLGTPLAPAFDHPSTFFSSHNLLNQPLNSLQSPGVPTPFLSLTAYYQSTMSSQFHQNDSAEVEALSTSWSPCICGPCTYFSLGFCFHSNHVALESWRGHFLCGLAKEKCKGAEHCLKMQNQCSGCAWTCRSILG